MDRVRLEKALNPATPGRGMRLTFKNGPAGIEGLKKLRQLVVDRKLDLLSPSADQAVIDLVIGLGEWGSIASRKITVRAGTSTFVWLPDLIEISDSLVTATLVQPKRKVYVRNPSEERVHEFTSQRDAKRYIDDHKAEGAVFCDEDTCPHCGWHIVDGVCSDCDR